MDRIFKANFKTGFILILLALTLVQCGESKKASLYAEGDVDALNKEIKANKEWHLNSDLIARQYFSRLYPDFVNENINVATAWKDNYMHVSITEDPSSDVQLQAARVQLVFQRPMGILRVEKIKHSWKCKNKPVFSAEPCSQ